MREGCQSVKKRRIQTMDERIFDRFGLDFTVQAGRGFLPAVWQIEQPG